jgi:ankyrin repeat protein
MKINALLSTTSAFQLLRNKFLDLQSEFHKRLLAECLSKSKVYLCFDGYDEVSSAHADILLTFLQDLVANKDANIQIWMTSRENMRQKLQEKLCTLAFYMLPFNNKNQIDFLKKCYNKQLSSSGSQTANKDIDTFSVQIHQNILKFSSALHGIMGIPLLLAMIASVNIENFNTYCKNKILNLQTTFKSMTQLYDDFFHSLVKRHLIEKEQSNYKLEERLERYIQRSTIVHCTLAMKSMSRKIQACLTEDEQSNLQTYITEKEEIQEIGIVREINANTIQFLHRTFAEYFVAKCMIKKLMNLSDCKNENYRESVIKTLNYIIIRHQTAMVRKFMNPLMLDFKSVVALFMPEILESTRHVRSMNFAIYEDNYNIFEFVLKTITFQESNATDTKRLQIKKYINDYLNYKKCALIYAVKKGQCDLVSLLLEHGAITDDCCSGDFDDCDTSSVEIGNSSLMFAAYYGHCNVVSLLLNHGVNVHFKDTLGSTALSMAVWKCHCDVVSLLLDHGANIHDKDVKSRSALMIASSNGHSDLVIWLLNKGCIINEADKGGKSVVMFAAKNGHSNVTSLLLDRGAKILHKTKYGMSALMYAAMYGHCATTSLLLARGAQIEDRNDFGVTSIMLAAEGGHSDVVSLLLERGANIDDKNNAGWSSLIYASKEGKIDAVSLLLASGANIHDKDNIGRSVLLHAALQSQSGSDQLIYLLNNIGKNIRYPSNAAVLSLLLENGADINDKDNDGNTALMCAARGNNCLSIPVLLNHGAQINNVNKDGNTALHLAVIQKHTDAFKHLVNKDTDLNILNNDGNTALHLAKLQKTTDAFKYLVHLCSEC